MYKNLTILYRQDISLKANQALTVIIHLQGI